MFINSLVNSLNQTVIIHVATSWHLLLVIHSVTVIIHVATSWHLLLVIHSVTVNFVNGMDIDSLRVSR